MLVLAVVGLVVLACAGALADSTPTPPDTSYTPNSDKPQAFWHRIGGAKYPEASVPGDSPTPFNVDFFTVAFRDLKHGYAGGVVHQQCPGGLRDLPVIYRYSVTALGVASWTLDYQGGCGSPGFVGALAWTADGRRVVAVGGDGSYPRREAGRDQGQTDAQYYAADPAGRGRAWIYDPHDRGDEAFHELDLGRQRAQGMRGMTALAFSPNKAVDAGAAGGLGQLWMWSDGRFTELIDAATDSSAPPGQGRIVNGAEFRFRVRQLRFLPGAEVNAVGITAGCCGQSPADGKPSVLSYDGQRWYVQDFAVNYQASLGSFSPSGAPRPGEQPALPDSFYAMGLVGDAGTSRFQLSVVASSGGPPPVAQADRGSVISQSACLWMQGPSPDGHLAAGDFVTGPAQLDQATEAFHANTSSTRLLAAGGDSAYGTLSSGAGVNEIVSAANDGPQNFDPNRPIYGDPSTLSHPDAVFDTCASTFDAGGKGDGVPDWAVGELLSNSTPGLGSQAVAVGTALRPSLVPGAVPLPAPDKPAAYQPPTAAGVQSYLASEQFLLPSYTLRALDVIGDSGVGWAVGDHGALLKLDQSVGSGSAGPVGARAPTVGQASPSPLPDASPYGAYTPPISDQPGVVPELAARPLLTLPTARLVGDGSPDPVASLRGENSDVAQIAMSRDGSQGWAVGPNPATGQGATLTLSLYHYDGSTWTACDMQGVPGQVAPDPACASLAPMRHFTLNGRAKSTVILSSIARVPLEKGADASRANDFEAVAVGSAYPASPHERPRAVILRYRQGIWRREDPGVRSQVDADQAPLGSPPGLTRVVFTAPDDGWALGVFGAEYRLYHYDGHTWANCAIAATGCGDPRSLTDFGKSGASTGDVVNGMVASGHRVWIYGSRLSSGTGGTAVGSFGSSGSTYPMVIYHDAGGSWSDDPADGGLDPAGGSKRAAPDPAAFQGAVRALATRPKGGGYQGLAVGSFGGTQGASVSVTQTTLAIPASTLLRLEGGHWKVADDTGPLHDYLSDTEHRTVVNNGPLTHAEAIITGAGREFVAQRETGRLFAYDEGLRRWSVVPAARPFGIGGNGGTSTGEGADGPVQAMAPDATDGFWMAVRNDDTSQWGQPHSQVYFYHYTNRVRKPVFEETPQPLHDSPRHFTALAGAPDGSVWAGTDSSLLLHYSRLTGWDRLTIAGWDPGRVVTRSSEVFALAVGSDGTGVAVGHGGRIADVSPGGVQLDSAVGTVCSAAPVGPCGTGEDLRAAAVAPDGSAMVAGNA
ncbi:MAG TPA: hypothetical protein VGN69_03305, partial [Solirubrobacteraceae bacterium]|nr:hypothetical protein [Solirubrobacteraceae bacterium]